MAGSSSPPLSDSLDSCDSPEDDPSRNRNPGGEGKQRKKFHPFRAVRNIFRRAKRHGSEEDPQLQSANSKKSRSTSELNSSSSQATSPAGDPHLGYGAVGGHHLPSSSTGSGCLQLSHAGLSVSHDSIFASDHNNSVSSGPALNDPGGQGQQGSVFSVQHMAGLKGFREELHSRFRGRRDSDDDDDPGLPHSPCTSPTTADVLAQGLKDKSSKSHSTCSAGSLISMCSSEYDEDVSGMLSSSYSSRRSADFDGELDVSQPVPLNHNAALHKMAVRPKRTHGLPKHRRMQQMALAGVGQSLPATPEVTEDSSLTQPVVVATAVEEVASMNEETIQPAEIVDTTSELSSTAVVHVAPTDLNEEAAAVEILAKPIVKVSQEVTPTVVPEVPRVDTSPTVSSPRLSDDTALAEAAEQDIHVPPVKPPKGKSKSAELKLRHEIKQFSRRQQEKLKDSTDQEMFALSNECLIRESHVGDVEVIDSISDQQIVDANDIVMMDIANTETKEETQKKHAETAAELIQRDDTSGVTKKLADVVEHEKPMLDKESYQEAIVTVNLNVERDASDDQKHVSEIKLVDQAESATAHQKKSEPFEAESTKSQQSLLLPHELEDVVLRHPEKACLHLSADISDESFKRQDEDPALKPVEPAFYSGDFAGIMKKRRSMTDSSADGVQPVFNRSVSEAPKQPTQSKRLSVEIVSFEQRAKEQLSKEQKDQQIKKDQLKQDEQTYDEPMPEPEVMVSPKIHKKIEDKPDLIPDSSALCPPVTIRIRRGKSLNEKTAEADSDAAKSAVKSPEKPVVRPRSNVFNQVEGANGKIPEFMKVQLRSSREELDASVTSQPQWEVKIHPQKNQLTSSAGPTSLPFLLNKSNSSEVKQDSKFTTKDVRVELSAAEPVVKDVIPKIEIRSESLEMEQKSKPLQHKPEVKLESSVYKDVEFKNRQTEDRLGFKPEDVTRVKRNSSENKENVASSNVQKELVERRVSIDDSKQEQFVDKPPVSDNRRRSFVHPKDNEEHEPELFRVFARRSYKQKSSEKPKKDEPSKEEVDKPMENSENNEAAKISGLKAAKTEVSRIPIKSKLEPKPIVDVKSPQKPEEVLKLTSKPFEKVSTPVNIQIADSPVSKVPATSPPVRASTQDGLPPKPERRESLTFKLKTSEPTENKLTQSTSKLVTESSPPNKPIVTSFRMADSAPSRIDRKESASFKVRPSESMLGKTFQSNERPRSETEIKDKVQSQESQMPKSVVAAVKRGEMVKTASLDSPVGKDSGKDAPTWLQLAQQRREKREQKERLLYGQNSNSFVLEGSTKPSRNSKVLDLVNNFQKLQTT